MGSNHSKIGFVPLTEFTPLVEFTTTLQGIAASLMKRMVKWTAIDLTERDQAEMDALENRKVGILRDIRMFCICINLQVQTIKSEFEKNLNESDVTTFHDLTYGKDNIATSEMLARYATACMELSSDYDHFGRRLTMKYGKTAVAKKLTGAVFIISGILITAALIYCTAGIAVPLAVSVAVLAAYTTSASLMVTGGTMMTDTEVERANIYIKNVGNDLTKISFNFQSLQTMCDKNMRVVVEKNFDYVLTLTEELSTGIEKAILAKFK